MTEVVGDVVPLKQKMRAMWMSGDFGKVAAFAAVGAAEFVARLDILPGMKVLDVACGTGNLSIPAAKAGADVLGVDIASNLLGQARMRAAAAGVAATFEEGDAEQLPCADSSFDLVMSMFGAMFAPRPDRVTAEFLRVCRPGGTIAMASWTRNGFVGQMSALTNGHAAPPAGVPSPLLWGDEATVRERLGIGASRIRCTRRMITLDYPFSPREAVAFFRQYYGPTAATFARLDGSAQDALAKDLERLWEEKNESGGAGTLVRSEYLEVLVTRA
jgi:SAM-dependent methyltransferase